MGLKIVKDAGMRPMSSSHLPWNRLTASRMRDGRRWTEVYREKAWEVALTEARKRTLFESLLFAIRMLYEARR